MELAKSLQRGEAPEEIHRQFEHRAVGDDRERLMSAYAQYRLAEATYKRKLELYNQRIISDQPLQEARAQFEMSQASYQSLMDQMEYQTRLALTRARQSLHQAETQIRVAREHLRILGIRAGEGSIAPLIVDSTAIDSGLLPTQENLGTPGNATAAPRSGEVKTEAVPFPTVNGLLVMEETPVSAFALRAPFDGTILDRELMVPGIHVDTSHHLFILADLSDVWVEASVHESDFGLLEGSRGGRVDLVSPAYPGRRFEGTVIYTGDLVDEKSRTLKVLARADNPDRMLKPGMFVEVKIFHREPRSAIQIPVSALLSDGEATFVYVKTGAEQFERRDVIAGDGQGGRVVVFNGLKGGEEVVIEGGYKIKAEAFQLASSK